MAILLLVVFFYSFLRRTNFEMSELQVTQHEKDWAYDVSAVTNLDAT